MKKIIVLGAGLVGLPMAKDLAKDSNFEVSLADIDNDKLASVKDKCINTIREDLSNRELLTSLVKPYDFVVNAVPGFMGFETLKRCIQSGKDTIDIAFYPEDVFELSDLAKEKEVRVICDIGVAPGMSNVLTGHAASKLDRVDNVEIYVGGLPKLRTKPWEYNEYKYGFYIHLLSYKLVYKLVNNLIHKLCQSLTAVLHYPSRMWKWNYLIKKF